MKKIVVVVMLLLILTGCNGKQGDMDGALQLRARLANTGCTFMAKVTADYGDTIYTFALQCSYSSAGDLQFTVKEQSTIEGIGGKITASGGELVFDDVALAFELLADGQLSPVSAPYILMKALRGGYMTVAGMDGEYTRVTVQDSYSDDALTVDVWINQENIPVQGEILFDGRRILTIQVESFTFE